MECTILVKTEQGAAHREWKRWLRNRKLRSFLLG
jgi:hypothetical protein